MGINKEIVLIITTEIMKTQGGTEMFVYRLNGNDYESIFSSGSDLKGGWEIITLHGENALLFHGSLFFLRDGKFKKVFEYKDSGCVYQGGCSFETMLKNENDKLYLYRRETLSNFPQAEDLQKEARWQKAEVIWNEKIDGFEQKQFQLAE